ncbi:uncharacterized protein BYT42DRAFT_77777 [Radiomyces spectabilis]|uniref:uncharacterized protein n=1 Tax=Radiomyces spectabilis TaxID=64574 RepID=UPI002221218F|nr:uncharacterized protein BYT42DRAFT_77777 [Radiomyces spectabilis]KAI8371694.1 hypothetical protein BYT42DRAFT_77777 [Radiomyces spectabilis]
MVSMHWGGHKLKYRTKRKRTMIYFQMIPSAAASSLQAFVLPSSICPCIPMKPFFVVPCHPNKVASHSSCITIMISCCHSKRSGWRVQQPRRQNEAQRGFRSFRMRHQTVTMTFSTHHH